MLLTYSIGHGLLIPAGAHVHAEIHFRQQKSDDPVFVTNNRPLSTGTSR